MNDARITYIPCIGYLVCYIPGTLAAYTFKPVTVAMLQLSIGMSQSSRARAEEPSGWWRVAGSDLEAPVLMRFSFTTDRRELSCSGVIVGADYRERRVVSTRAARVPVAAIVSDAARLFRQKGASATSEYVRALGLSDDEYAVLMSGGYARPRSRPGAKGYDESWWSDFAREYLDAERRQPGKAIKALTEKYEDQELSMDTIKYRVQQLRRRGLIPKAVRRRGGKRR